MNAEARDTGRNSADILVMTSTLYRFRIQVSDVDRGVYESLDFRLAMHPSETAAYLLTRVLAYALNAEPGLEFNPEGLADPDLPCIQKTSPNGGYDLWIEVGNPSARKMHRASKAASRFKIYTYKDPRSLISEIAGQSTHRAIHRASEIEIYSLASRFLDEIAGQLERDNSWNLTCLESALILSIGDKVLEGELQSHRP